MNLYHRWSEDEGDERMSPTQPLMVPAIETHPIPPAIAEEIDTFEAEAVRLLAGDVSSDLFRPFRLQQWIYGQR